MRAAAVGFEAEATRGRGVIFASHRLNHALNDGVIKVRSRTPRQGQAPIAPGNELVTIRRERSHSGGVGEPILPFVLKAAAGAKIGDHVGVDFVTSADGALPLNAEVPVTIVDGATLTVTDKGTSAQAEPGHTVEIPTTVYNVGIHAATEARFTYAFDGGLVPD